MYIIRIIHFNWLRKSTQLCNINIAIQGIFMPQIKIIVIFNIKKE